MTLNEVAPPGFGHTKGDKKKGVEKGGTAAAFDRARKEGRFKGSKSDMFAIMWSQKNKGDKPHYKPGTDKKYKKYQEEETTMRDNNLYGNAYAGSRLGFKIDSGDHRKAQRAKKIRDRTKTGDEGSEIAKKKVKGPKLYGEGKTWDSYKKVVDTVLGKKKKKEKKKATMDPTTDKLHDWRQKNSPEQRDREEYVSFTRPIERG